MKTSIVSTIAAGLLVLAGSAHAGTIASATIYGAFNQDTAECVVRNVGKANVTVDVNIYDESGNVVPASGSCAASITPGSHCFKRAIISSGLAYACSATIAGNTKDLRANLVLIDDIGSNENPLRSVVLR
jgi:hypothetical protein